MTEVQIRPATIEDAVAFAPRLRAADLAEILAHTGLPPAETISAAVSCSEQAWVVDFDSAPALIGGVRLDADSVLTGRAGTVWMLTTHEVERHRKAFIRTCRAMLGALLEDWDELRNNIDARYERALRWAEHLGFRVGAPAPFGIAGLPFAPVSVTRKDIPWATPSQQ